MQEEQLNQFISSHKDCFSKAQMAEVSDRASRVMDSKAEVLMSLKTRRCTAMIWISILLGVLGVDCFLLGRNGRGVLKLLTFGGLGILWVIDIVHIRQNTWAYNYKRFNNALLSIYGYF